MDESFESGYQVVFVLSQQHKPWLIDRARSKGLTVSVVELNNMAVSRAVTITSPTQESTSYDDIDQALRSLRLQLQAHAAHPILVVDGLTTDRSLAEQTLQKIVGDVHAGSVIVAPLRRTATQWHRDLGGMVSVEAYPGFCFLEQSATSLEYARALQDQHRTDLFGKAMLETLGYTLNMCQDAIGLIGPRVLATLINEAAFAVLENVASEVDIDTAMKLGTNYPKGLLEWADSIGIDVVAELLDALYNEYHQERYRACVLLRQMYRAGWLGQRTGRGFFQYPAERGTI